MERSIARPTRPHTRASRIGWGLVAATILASLMMVFSGVAMSASAGATGKPAPGSAHDNKDKNKDKVEDPGTVDDDVDGEHKVTLCHATHSFTNPYVTITVDYHAVIMAGHGDHEGPVFTPTMDPRTKWGDIIPPFDFGGDAVYPGMNWTAEGQAILDNDCNVVIVPDTTVPPTTTPPTTTAPTTAPPTTTAPTTTPATTVPDEPTTTTTAAVGGGNETGPATAIPNAEGSSTSTTPAVPPVQVRGVSVERAPTQTPPATGTLPLTGANVALFALVATALISAGALTLAARRRIEA